MPHDCPSCPRTFDSRRGLGVHHSRVHGDRLPNRTCDYCGNCFYSEYEKRYCSDACLDASDSYAGENNPNYRGGKESTGCELCGTEFDYYPSEKDGLFCSECVRTEAWRRTPDVDRERNPQWNGGQVERECHVCGTPVERYPSELECEGTVCSDDCRAEWLSETFTGEGHPNWEGGDVGPYGPGWNAVRREALERDDYACVVCGTGREELDRNPDVHHLVPVRAYVEAPDREVRDAHRIDNVVSLCVDCHRKADVGSLSRETLERAAELGTRE